MELEPLGQLQLDLTERTELGKTPAGRRSIVSITGGKMTGERLTGTVKGPAADWFLLRPDRSGTLDVRFTLETDDGAVILVSYTGKADFSQGFDAPMYSCPTFETGDERYAWLNGVQAVAKGTMEGVSLTYEVCLLR